MPETAEVYAAPDGRPALRVRELALDGAGVEFVVVKSGMPVRWWAPDSEVPSERWKPTLPDDIADGLVTAEARVEELEDENEALVAALKKAMELLPHAGREVVRHVYRQNKPQT